MHRLKAYLSQLVLEEENKRSVGHTTVKDLVWPLDHIFDGGVAIRRMWKFKHEKMEVGEQEIK